MKDPVNKSIPVPIELEEIARKTAGKMCWGYQANALNAQVILSALTEACQSRDVEIERLNRKLGEFTCRD